jgi:asparagine synthase (glutamine-hydrolysing)
MPFSRDGWTIVFNGEIYNHESLREQLMLEGLEFHTTSDTEVLLAGLARHGTSFLDRAEGMWAFAAVNTSSHELFLSRDRFGEKPLFVYECSHGQFFASEPKTLSALAEREFKVNDRQILRYLVNGYRSLFKCDETWFEELRAFPSATVRTLSPLGKPKDTQFWKLTGAQRDLSEQEAIEHLRYLLPKAIGCRLRADVPIACCLSGGVDSASIASLAVKALGSTIHAFSIIDSNPLYDERSHIQAVVNDLGCRATFIEVPQASFIERLEDLISYHDGPLATSSYYIHSFLSEAISNAGYRVSLSGTGADEMFSGYYDHYLMHIAELYGTEDFLSARDAWCTHVQPVVRNPLLQDWDRFIQEPDFRGHLYIRNPVLVSGLRKEFSETFREHDFGRTTLRNRMLNEMFFEVVPPILHEDDLNSMRWSVENRSPFLDRTLFEFCTSLPSRHLIVDGFQKSLLRKAMEGILTNSVRLNRKKVGFNASMTTLLDRQAADVRNYLMTANPLFDYVTTEVLTSLLDKPDLSNQESQLLFSLINVSVFLKKLY